MQRMSDMLTRWLEGAMRRAEGDGNEAGAAAADENPPPEGEAVVAAVAEEVEQRSLNVVTVDPLVPSSILRSEDFASCTSDCDTAAVTATSSTWTDCTVIHPTMTTMLPALLPTATALTKATNVASGMVQNTNSTVEPSFLADSTDVQSLGHHLPSDVGISLLPVADATKIDLSSSTDADSADLREESDSSTATAWERFSHTASPASLPFPNESKQSAISWLKQTPSPLMTSSSAASETDRQIQSGGSDPTKSATDDLGLEQTVPEDAEAGAVVNADDDHRNESRDTCQRRPIVDRPISQLEFPSDSSHNNSCLFNPADKLTLPYTGPMQSSSFDHSSSPDVDEDDDEDDDDDDDDDDDNEDDRDAESSSVSLPAVPVGAARQADFPQRATTAGDDRDVDLERHLAAIQLQEIFRKRQVQKEERQASGHLPRPAVRQVFRGHRNSRTMIKKATFWGTRYVMSGSDCGHIFIWDRESAKLVMLLEGDRHVVNCLQAHPFYPVLASSGIDYDIKLWMPTSEEPVFDESLANELMKRNEVMLLETRDTITVPATFMLRMLASLSQARRAAAVASQQRPDA
jgi:hypothetical protein